MGLKNKNQTMIWISSLLLALLAHGARAGTVGEAGKKAEQSVERMESVPCQEWPEGLPTPAPGCYHFVVRPGRVISELQAERDELSQQLSRLTWAYRLARGAYATRVAACAQAMGAFMVISEATLGVEYEVPSIPWRSAAAATPVLSMASGLLNDMVDLLEEKSKGSIQGIRLPVFKTQSEGLIDLDGVKRSNLEALNSFRMSVHAALDGTLDERFSVRHVSQEYMLCGNATLKVALMRETLNYLQAQLDLTDAQIGEQ